MATKKPSAKVRFPPATPEMEQRLDALAPADPGITRGKMFGCPCVFVNGKLSFFVFGDSLVLRLSEADREKLLQLDGARPFAPMPGRTSKASVIVPADLAWNTAAIRPWVKRAIAFASSRATGATGKPRKPAAKAKRARAR